MANHTTGPWRFEAPFTILGTDERSCGEIPIATVHSFVGTEGRAANAALIAAAPEMLAALQRVERILDNAANLLRDDPAQVAYALIDVRAAIAKAEGR